MSFAFQMNEAALLSIRLFSETVAIITCGMVWYIAAPEGILFISVV